MEAPDVFPADRLRSRVLFLNVCTKERFLFELKKKLKSCKKKDWNINGKCNGMISIRMWVFIFN